MTTVIRLTNLDGSGDALLVVEEISYMVDPVNDAPSKGAMIGLKNSTSWLQVKESVKEVVDIMEKSRAKP